MDATITKRTDTSFTIEIEIPYEKQSLLDAEDLIQQQINKAGALATGEALTQFDTDGSPLWVDGTKLTSKGLIRKCYQTPYGDVEVMRHIYQSSKGGRGYCPLEYQARIITTATPKLAKMVSSKYAEMCGAHVQKDLAENHGRSLSKSHIQAISDVVGSLASVKEAAWTYTLPTLEREVASVAVGLDGTCMMMCEDGARQAMVGTVALYDAEGERLHTLYTAARPEYGKQVFFQQLEQEVTRVKQAYPTATYVGVADGATDNWTFLERYTDIQTVDFFHAAGYVGQVGQAVFPTEAEPSWTDTTCHALKHTDDAAAQICGEMQQFLTRPLSPSVRATIDTAVTYFKNQGPRMTYAQNLAAHLPIGSGVTEAACKVIVKQRLCGAGMRWKDHGASVVLTLRCLRYTEGRWAQFWQKIDRYGFSLASVRGVC